MSSIAENVARVKERIRRAAERAGHDAAGVRLVAVSKTMPAETVREAFLAGARLFGENYVQEAVSKIESLHIDAEFHFIGHLQTNKVKYVAPHVTMIHSVDSAKLAQEISRRAEQLGRVMDILIQVNVAGEESKFGIRPDVLVPLLREIAPLKGVAVKGLMTMPPFFDQPERVRPFFRALRELAESVKDVPPTVETVELSMGMSGDFEVAVEEGATLVRVGTSIFGTRG